MESYLGLWVESFCLGPVILKVRDPNPAAIVESSKHNVDQLLHVGYVVEDEMAERDIELLGLKYGIVGAFEKLDFGGDFVLERVGGELGGEHVDHTLCRVEGKDGSDMLGKRHREQAGTAADLEYTRGGERGEAIRVTQHRVETESRRLDHLGLRIPRGRLGTKSVVAGRVVGRRSGHCVVARNGEVASVSGKDTEDCSQGWLLG